MLKLMGVEDAEFQFTPLREGRPPETEIIRLEPKFQFTPLREGRRGSTQAVA